jgi:23S rRNA (cytosine1962-C5)-methyltransferase
MEKPAGTIHLKRGRDKPVRLRHPWIFSGAIDRVEGEPEPGDLVNVASQEGILLAQAYFNPHSQIVGRILSWDLDEAIDSSFWSARIGVALASRAELELEPATTCYRLVNAESDGLPGLVVDKYGDFLVMQCLTSGIDRRKEMICRMLEEMVKPAGIVERSDMAVRKQENLKRVTGHCHGLTPPSDLVVRENGLSFSVDLWRGHKTGFYLDQRDNRALATQPQFVAGKELLNVFSYTGGFAVYAAAHAAGPITNVDSSADLLARAEANVLLNTPDRIQDEYVEGDAFELLRYYRDSTRRFDMVILDPPKFAHRQRDVERASRGYKDLNWLACRLLRPGGILATFSCSGRIKPELFQKIVFGAALDAKRDVQILHKLGQAPDHPILLSFPESSYLNGLLCRVK